MNIHIRFEYYRNCDDRKYPYPMQEVKNDFHVCFLDSIVMSYTASRLFFVKDFQWQNFFKTKNNDIQ